jgi:hypothetical protein
MMMSVSDIKETIRVKQDVDWFLGTFEITIDDLVDRFSDLIAEKKNELPYLLGMEYEPEEYEDR